MKKLTIKLLQQIVDKIVELQLSDLNDGRYPEELEGIKVSGFRDFGGHVVIEFDSWQDPLTLSILQIISILNHE